MLSLLCLSDGGDCLKCAWKTVLDLGPVAPVSVNFNHQLTQHHRHDNSNSRASSANGSSIKWVSQLTV